MKSTFFKSFALFLIVPALVASVHADDKNDLPTFLKTAADNVTLSGLIEVEGFVGRDFEDKDSSDVTLATAQLGIDAELAPWASSVPL